MTAVLCYGVGDVIADVLAAARRAGRSPHDAMVALADEWLDGLDMTAWRDAALRRMGIPPLTHRARGASAPRPPCARLGHAAGIGPAEKIGRVPI